MRHTHTRCAVCYRRVQQVMREPESGVREHRDRRSEVWCGVGEGASEREREWVKQSVDRPVISSRQQKCMRDDERRE